MGDITITLHGLDTEQLARITGLMKQFKLEEIKAAGGRAPRQHKPNQNHNHRSAQHERHSQTGYA